jgi:DNA-binding CsgD family transcriptional regulator
VVIDAVTELSTITSLNVFAERVLDLIGRLIPFGTAMYTEIEPGAPRGVVVVRRGPGGCGAVFPVTLERLVTSLGEDAAAAVLVPRDGATFRRSDVLRTDELHALAYYREVLRPLAAEHLLVAGLAAPDGFCVGLTLARTTEDFSAAELALLELLRPHIGRTLAQLRRTDRLGRVLKILAGGRPCVTIRITGDGAFTLTGGGRSSVARWFPPGSLLRDDLRAWVARQRRSATPGRRPAEAPAGDPYVIRSLDVLLVAHWRGASQDGDLVDLEEVVIDGTELRALGLTAREAEVLALQLIGAEAAAIAQRLGSRPATVKKQIENMYRKLGVHTRREAVTVALDAMIGSE